MTLLAIRRPVLACPAVDVLEAIFARRSIGRLTDPGPEVDQLATLLRAAAAAPDHGELRPWHFIVLAGDDRLRLGEVLASSAQARAATRGTTLTAEQLERERRKLLRAPTVIVAACRPQPGKIPVVEQAAAVAAATQNLLLAATGLGFASMWRTGAATEDPAVKEALGLEASDTIVGFVYVGTIPEGGEKAPNDPDPGDAVTYGLRG